MQWRRTLAHAAGMPPLERIEGYTQHDPIRWEWLPPSPLHVLLNHSDCEGEIPAEACEELADALEALLPNLRKGYWQERTRRFIKGLRLAAAAGEPVKFH
jgi:hypothetical protein